jgi:hypothetical protein
VGGYATDGYAQAVAVSGRYAYVADGVAGLQVVDVSDPANPRRVGGYDTPTGANGVAVSGSYAYVAGASGSFSVDAFLEVLDVSDPANPRRVGGYDTLWSAEGVAVSGPYAYVAAKEAGLQVVDVSNPAKPVRVGGYDTPGPARAVAVSGNYAYVADGKLGLQILRIGEAATPPLRIEGPLRLTGEGFESWLSVPTAGTYRVESSGDLRSWETLVTLTNVSGRVRVVDPAATSAAQRFYRAVRLP